MYMLDGRVVPLIHCFMGRTAVTLCLQYRQRTQDL